MSETTTTEVADQPDLKERREGVPVDLGLLARLAGVIVAPRATFETVARRPRSLGVLAVGISVLVLAQGVLLSTQVGQDIVIDQQIRAREAFGTPMTDEQIAQLEQFAPYYAYFGAAQQAIVIPLLMAAIAGILHVVFGLLGGSAGAFKGMFAVVAHSGIVLALTSLFTMPLSYARGEFAGANLGVFFPMLDEMSFAARLLDNLDLVIGWWLVVLAIGTAVYYKRRTGPIATGLILVYVCIVTLIAVLRS